jgi:hypothetical protein
MFPEFFNICNIAKFEFIVGSPTNSRFWSAKRLTAIFIFSENLPGAIITLFEPNFRIDQKYKPEPLPMAVNNTTEATPIITPNIVSNDRPLLT